MYPHLSHSNTRGSDQPPSLTYETAERNFRAQDDDVVPAQALIDVHVAQGPPPPAASSAPVPTSKDVARVPDGAVTCPLRITTPCPPVLAPPVACAQDEQPSIPCARSAHMPPTDKEGSVVETPPAQEGHDIMSPAVEKTMPPGRRIGGPVELPVPEVPDEDDGARARRRQAAHRSDSGSRERDAPAFPCFDSTMPRSRRDAQPSTCWKTSDERFPRFERDEGRADCSPIHPRTVLSTVRTAPMVNADTSCNQCPLAAPSLWEPMSSWSARAAELAANVSDALSSPCPHFPRPSPSPMLSAPPASPPLSPTYMPGLAACSCSPRVARVDVETEGDLECGTDVVLDGALDSASSFARRTFSARVENEDNILSIPHPRPRCARASPLPDVLVWSVRGISYGPEAADAHRGAQASFWSSSASPVAPARSSTGSVVTGGHRMRTVKLKVPMPSYDGTPDLDVFEAFAFKWNSWARSKDLTEEESVEYMAHALQGKAAQWFMRYVAGRQHEWTLNRAYSELFNNCFPPMFRERLRRRLLSLRQNGRPVRDFAQDIENLALRFPDIGEYSVKMILWDGVDNYIREFWREKGRSMEFDSFDTLVEYAYRVESREEERLREEAGTEENNWAEEEQNSDGEDTHLPVSRASQDADPNTIPEEPQISRVAVDGESGDQEEYLSEGGDYFDEEEGSEVISDREFGAEDFALDEEEPREDEALYGDEYENDAYISEGSQIEGEVYYNEDEELEYEDEERVEYDDGWSGEEDNSAEAHELDSSPSGKEIIPTHYRRRNVHY
ncbi:hypothetical protein EXIGLDRAFT_697732 [Exidia glandulosa HHB12029]|uniref:Retrotransposon gag domain-containing protein n=1 Tax=Exidia glandulosa HHB12029 TaxID=1314781 RepID=A0A165MWK6_EXIGL|nr:hypothetical protein EXIGLDRAFT_697732 [Exidia glandulosa HHB12029]